MSITGIAERLRAGVYGGSYMAFLRDASRASSKKFSGSFFIIKITATDQIGQDVQESAKMLADLTSDVYYHIHANRMSASPLGERIRGRSREDISVVESLL